MSNNTKNLFSPFDPNRSSFSMAINSKHQQVEKNLRVVYDSGGLQGFKTRMADSAKLVAACNVSKTKFVPSSSSRLSL